MPKESKNLGTIGKRPVNVVFDWLETRHNNSNKRNENKHKRNGNNNNNNYNYDGNDNKRDNNNKRYNDNYNDDYDSYVQQIQRFKLNLNNSRSRIAIYKI